MHRGVLVICNSVQIRKFPTPVPADKIVKAHTMYTLGILGLLNNYMQIESGAWGLSVADTRRRDASHRVGLDFIRAVHDPKRQPDPAGSINATSR